GVLGKRCELAPDDAGRRIHSLDRPVRAAAANHHRQARELGIAKQLDRRVERVHVEMGDQSRVQRLQNASSNPTSSSTTTPRFIPETPMKRMLIAYLLALISGTHGRSLSTATRRSWATLVVVSMSWNTPW